MKGIMPMKKLLCIFLALTMVLSLVGCGKQIDDNPPPVSDDNPGVSDTDTPAEDETPDQPIENQWNYDFDGAFIEENGLEYIWAQLDEQTRIALGEVMNAIKNVEIYCSLSRGIPTEGSEEFLKLVSFCSMAYTYESNVFRRHTDENGKVIGITLNYNVNYEEEAHTRTQELDSAINEIISGMPDGSDYDKIKYLHDALILKCDYSENAVSPFTAYGALVEGRATCQGYADAMHLLLSRAGYETCFATGIGESEAVTHKWNYVLVGDDWYIIDPTWNDPEGEEDKSYINYDYLFISEEVLLTDHKETFDSPYYDVPLADSMELNYHIVNGYYAEDYEQLKEIVKGQVEACVANGTKYIYVRCANQEVFDLANSKLFSGDCEMQKILIDVKDATDANIRTNSWVKVTDEGPRTLTITLKYED